MCLFLVVVWVVFIWVVFVVFGTYIPKYTIFFLFCLIYYPIEAHVNVMWFYLLVWVVDDALCRWFVSDNWCWGLSMLNLNEGRMDKICNLVVGGGIPYFNSVSETSTIYMMVHTIYKVPLVVYDSPLVWGYCLAINIHLWDSLSLVIIDRRHRGGSKGSYLWLDMWQLHQGTLQKSLGTTPYVVLSGPPCFSVTPTSSGSW